MAIRRSKFKGIILAGGNGSRLYPASKVVCKQLMPVYDKPMICYPLATLMDAGITEILIISTADDIPRFQRLLGDGAPIGLELSYAVQPKPEGIAQALLIGREFIGSDPVALILGDNIFYQFNELRGEIDRFEQGGVIFGYSMEDPSRFGVIEFDGAGKPITIDEKPEEPKSNYAVSGLYLYDASCVDIAASLTRSDRGELEITDVNNAYLNRGQLRAVSIANDAVWLDTGTPESMLAAWNFVAEREKETGSKIACVEEVAYRNGLISGEQFRELVDQMIPCDYRTYLLELGRSIE